MNGLQYIEHPSGLVEHLPRRDAFVGWSVSRQPRRAIWATTALFGGVGCSVLHVQNVTAAAITYLIGYGLALVMMVPWFLADYSINRGWRR